MILQGKLYTIDTELCNLLSKSNQSKLFTIENKYTGDEIEEAIVSYITHHDLWTFNESIYVNEDIKNIIGDTHLVFLEDLYHKLIHKLTIV